MTPAARYQAAIDILERILAQTPAEQALTGWARTARFAGAKDRAAIRDIVFDALRCKRSYAHFGGALTGRGLILGALHAQGTDPATIFTGTGYAPAPLTLQERDHQPEAMPEAVALDCPDWLIGPFRESLGPDMAPILHAMRQRAPVFLRVNIARITPQRAIALLAEQGITARHHPLAPTALEVTANARAVHRSNAYLDGLVELQDAASQAVIATLPDPAGLRVLDYCAGGGGKSLALAALGAKVSAHDAAPARMKDLPERARRAGVEIIPILRPQGAYDLVLADVPCSGSGSWRRTPAAKWALTPERLAQLQQLQSDILNEALAFVAPGGWLAYVTCSLLSCENHRQISAFSQRHPAATLLFQQQFTPLDGGDGLFVALLRK